MTLAPDRERGPTRTHGFVFGSWLNGLGATAVRMAGAVPEPVRNIMRALPTQPPSFALARVLNRVLLPRLDAEIRLALSGRAVHVELQDLGLRLRLQLNARGFGLAPSQSTPTVTIHSTSAALWRLASGVDDADRLFFERALVMEGDTEFGLLLKNTLDAIGPLWG